MRREFTQVVKTTHGHSLAVHIRQKGDVWGKDDMLTHEDDEAVIEFDTWDIGYQISSYLRSTFMSLDSGVCLNDDVAYYGLSHPTVEIIQTWIKSCIHGRERI